MTFPSRAADRGSAAAAAGRSSAADRDHLSRAADLYTSPLDEVTNRRLAGGGGTGGGTAASFQFSSDEDEHAEIDR